MIRIQIPGFHEYSGDGRWGDAQIVTDGTYTVVIDGYCGDAADMLIDILKDRNLKDVYLYCSHPHYDHLDGLRKIMMDGWFNVKGFASYDPDSLNGGKSNYEIQDDINYLAKTVTYARSKNINVKYLKHGDVVTHGDIKFNVYREQPSYNGVSEDPHGWSYVNDGSLCFYFPELRYWTSGDGPEKIYTLCKRVGAKPIIFKIPHHGNNCTKSQANGMVVLGAIICWDNSYQTEIDDFLRYGRGRCIEAGLKYIGIHGDINIVACNGKIHVYKDWAVYSFDCDYMGANTLIGADDSIVNDVINNKAGNGNDRMSYLLNHGYDPFSVQNAVNKKLAEPVEEKWVRNAKGWWYRYSDGSWAVGWAYLPWGGAKSEDKKDWFYFNSKGYMVTGWRYLAWSGGKSWFYLDKTNGNMKTGWVKDNGYWYYLNLKTGAMQIGWLDYNGKKCYLEPIGGKNQGHAYCNEISTIDGKTYRFDKYCYATEVVATGEITTVTGKLNSMSASHKQFVIDIANYVRKYAPQYGICVYSPIIAQAIHESGWGESKLSAKYHNYFGLKCGTKWTGKSVNMSTQEEYSAGSLTTISANFRAYDSMEEGVKGYFEFIQLPRYSNLKGVTSPRQYLTNIKNDGYATGSKYVDNTMNLINLYSLTQFDVPITVTQTKETSADDPIEVMIQIAKAEVGYHEGANNHTKYGDEMHSIQPRNMDKNAAWCDAFCDWVILQTCKAFGSGADMAREVLCGDFDDYTYSSVNLYKRAGRWTQTPSKGHQIFFGGSGHTGMVIDVVGNTVYTIEGNKSDQVKECSYNKSNSNIIGYGIPKYELLNGEISADNLPLLKRGSTGYFVLHLQKMLNKADYAGKQILEEDGEFGVLTEAQVKLYQKDRGLEADGEVGPLTWGALYIRGER